MSMFVTAAITIGGGLLQGKIASNRGQKGPIGTGTAPALEPGAPLDISPVQGSDVQDFGAATEGFADPEIDRSRQEQELIQQLIEAGYDPEALGIAGLAFGGPLYRSNGGGLESLFDLANLDLASLSDFTGLKPPSLPYGPYQDDVRDMILTEDYKIDFPEAKGEAPRGPFPDFKPKPSKPSEIFSSTSPDLSLSNILIDDPTVVAPVVPEGQGMMAQMGDWWEGQDAGVQTAMLSAATDVIGEMFKKPAKGSLVSTQTLPGNSSRRRATQMNIKPIQGSVRTAARGGVLDRQMFQPSQETYTGGPMNGPGGPKDDLIPVMASNGEYMLSKAAVDAAGDGSHAMGIANLNRFNEMGNKRYG